MMKECKRKEYVNAKGKSFAVECLSMALIFQQQKMISQLFQNFLPYL